LNKKTFFQFTGYNKATRPFCLSARRKKQKTRSEKEIKDTWDVCWVRRRAWRPVLKRERDDTGSASFKNPSRKAKG